MIPGVRHVDRVLIGALLLSSPTILQAFQGAQSVASALVRFAGALALCWAGAAIIERLYAQYSRQARRAEVTARLAQFAAAREAAAARLVEESRSSPMNRPGPGG